MSAPEARAVSFIVSNDIPAVLARTFLGLGLVLLVSALLAYVGARRFLDAAVIADGRITHVDAVSVDRGGSRTSGVKFLYWVDFTTSSGQVMRFFAGRTSRRAYMTGDHVDVLYLPDRPDKALVRSLSSPWGLSVILGVTGGPFLLGGGILHLPQAARAWRRRQLLRHGTRVQAKVRAIKRDRGVFSGGRHPFVIVCAWRDPETTRWHVFHSAYLWADPRAQVSGRELDVHVMPGNPRYYHVDISFIRSAPAPAR